MWVLLFFLNCQLLSTNLSNTSLAAAISQLSALLAAPSTWSSPYRQQPVETPQSSALTTSSLPSFYTADNLRSLGLLGFFVLFCLGFVVVSFLFGFVFSSSIVLNWDVKLWHVQYVFLDVSSAQTQQFKNLPFIFSLWAMPLGLSGQSPGCLGLSKALWFHGQALSVLWILSYTEIIYLQTQFKLI